MKAVNGMRQVVAVGALPFIADSGHPPEDGPLVVGA
jgi:hypothetical protein